MEIQKNILLYFSSIHNNLLDSIAKFFTFFGEDIPLMIILLFIYWCIDKKKGLTSCLVLVTASQLMSLIKAIVRFPRPWLVITELDTQRIQTATGYSFPSGHTTDSSATFSSLAFSFKKRWLSVLCAFFILLVGISRNYLCCHWPIDVLCGWMLGIGTSMILVRFIDSLLRKKNVLLFAGIVCSLVALVCSVLLCYEKIDYLAFSDFSKAFATGGGFILGYCLFDFSVEKGNWKKKIVRYVVGMIGMALLLPLSKPLLQSLGIYNPFTAQLRYFLTALWASFWPFISSSRQ